MCWFFRKRKEKKKALQEEQLKMQQESMKKESIQKEKPAPQPVKPKVEEPVKKVEEKKEAPKPVKEEVKKTEPKKEDAKPVKAKVKEETEKEDKNATNPKYHVSQNKDKKSPAFKQWRVRKEGSKKTIKYFDTQAEAIDYAEDLAKKNDTSVVIHKVDGSIRKQEY